MNYFKISKSIGVVHLIIIVTESKLKSCPPQQWEAIDDFSNSCYLHSLYVLWLRNGVSVYLFFHYKTNHIDIEYFKYPLRGTLISMDPQKLGPFIKDIFKKIWRIHTFLNPLQISAMVGIKHWWYLYISF